MPTYEYRCLECGHQFEAFQSMQEDPIKVCPECGKRVERLISGGSGLIFKGSGFYITDYQRKHSSGKPDLSETKKSGEKKEKSSADN
jgi:putative FmdB family regulatory protein